MLVAAILAVALWQFLPLIKGASSASPIFIPNKNILRSTGLVEANLSSIVESTVPPANIVTSVYVPEGSQSLGHQNLDHSMGVFNRLVFFEARLSPISLLEFARSSLRNHGWSILGSYLVPRSPLSEILAKKAGTDGNYWEVSYATVLPHLGSPGPSHTTSSNENVLTKFQIQVQEIQPQE